MKTPNTKNQLIDQNNEIRAKHLKLKSKLSDLTEQELFIWIAGATLDFGRSFQDSIDNALLHMNDRKNAERIFSTKQTA